MQTNFKRAAVKSFVVSALALSAAGFSINASAAVATGNMTVGADVVATCTITTTAMTFGTYNAAASTAALNGAGTVSTTCTNGSAVTVTLGQGQNASGASTDAAPVRQMANGANLLAYQLFSEAARTTVWGNTPSTGLADTGTGAASALTIYGTIAANQNVPVGAYSDTVLATVTF